MATTDAGTNEPTLVLTLTNQDGVVLDTRTITWARWIEAQNIQSSAAALIWGLNPGARPRS